MFEKELTFIKQHHLEDIFEEQAYTIVEHACKKWRHQDSLSQSYEHAYGEFIHQWIKQH